MITQSTNETRRREIDHVQIIACKSQNGGMGSSTPRVVRYSLQETKIIPKMLNRCMDESRHGNFHPIRLVSLGCQSNGPIGSSTSCTQPWARNAEFPPQVGQQLRAATTLAKSERTRKLATAPVKARNCHAKFHLIA